MDRELKRIKKRLLNITKLEQNKVNLVKGQVQSIHEGLQEFSYLLHVALVSKFT